MNAFEEFVGDHVDWSTRTFGPADERGPRGPLAHLRLELDEIEAEPYDVVEWVDVILLAIDGATRAGATPSELWATLVGKAVRNRARTWPDWRTVPADEAVEHDREVDEAGMRFVRYESAAVPSTIAPMPNTQLDDEGEEIFVPHLADEPPLTERVAAEENRMARTASTTDARKRLAETLGADRDLAGLVVAEAVDVLSRIPGDSSITPKLAIEIVEAAHVRITT